jgi:hypothetical protein
MNMDNIMICIALVALVALVLGIVALIKAGGGDKITSKELNKILGDYVRYDADLSVHNNCCPGVGGTLRAIPNTPNKGFPSTANWGAQLNGKKGSSKIQLKKWKNLIPSENFLDTPPAAQRPPTPMTPCSKYTDNEPSTNFKNWCVDDKKGKFFRGAEPTCRFKSLERVFLAANDPFGACGTFPKCTSSKECLGHRYCVKKGCSKDFCMPEPTGALIVPKSEKTTMDECNTFGNWIPSTKECNWWEIECG